MLIREEIFVRFCSTISPNYSHSKGNIHLPKCWKYTEDTPAKFSQVWLTNSISEYAFPFSISRFFLIFTGTTLHNDILKVHLYTKPRRESIWIIHERMCIMKTKPNFEDGISMQNSFEGFYSRLSVCHIVTWRH